MSITFTPAAVVYPLNVSQSGPVDPTPALIAGANSSTAAGGGMMASFGLPVAGLASLVLLQVFVARRFLRKRTTVR